MTEAMRFTKKIVAAVGLLALCGCKPALGRVDAVGDRRQSIVGGEAQPPVGPWYVSLQYRGMHLCGGSLLAADIVITAAHCFELSNKVSDYEIFAGLFGGRNVPSAVQSIKIHPDYLDDSNSNDLALIRLANPLGFSDSIAPICLPDGDVPTDESAEALFWGEKQGTGNNRPLLQLTVPIVPNSVANDRAHYRGRIDDTMMAAGSGGKDACLREDGAPLVMKRKDAEDTWMLAGISSWGGGCDDGAWMPGIYARVSSGIRWITSTVQSLSASPGLPTDCGHQAVKKGS
ncbi:serine protease [Nannocystis bainbridge]|uniref:Serine protease n=1 Tax=Nannocystis bainbridge TaxID=2995303 RepID=A0ABT5E624_9BACT|nr:serine protease [Nannocystis bainbridge]MDC0721140.1 serine protease [Nannocystis bainbridge]